MQSRRGRNATLPAAVARDRTVLASITGGNQSAPMTFTVTVKDVTPPPVVVSP